MQTKFYTALIFIQYQLNVLIRPSAEILDYRFPAGINVDATRGQLLAVVGRVGSAKSSLLSALLGIMIID